MESKRKHAILDVHMPNSHTHTHEEMYLLKLGWSGARPTVIHTNTQAHSSLLPTGRKNNRSRRQTDLQHRPAWHMRNSVFIRRLQRHSQPNETWHFSINMCVAVAARAKPQSTQLQMNEGRQKDGSEYRLQSKEIEKHKIAVFLCANVCWIYMRVLFIYNIFIYTYVFCGTKRKCSNNDDNDDDDNDNYVISSSHICESKWNATLICIMFMCVWSRPNIRFNFHDFGAFHKYIFCESNEQKTRFKPNKKEVCKGEHCSRYILHKNLNGDKSWEVVKKKILHSRCCRTQNMVYMHDRSYPKEANARENTNYTEMYFVTFCP